MNVTVTAFVGLGSNMGDRAGMLRRALRALRTIRGVRVDDQRGVAPLYETSPVGGPVGQPAYLNSAVCIQTRIGPAALLDRLLRIETTLGRTRGVAWDRRVIDLDLLLYGQVALDLPELTLPHPRLHQRRFVLEPLAEIAPDVVHPILGRTICDLASELRNGESDELVVRVGGPDWPIEMTTVVTNG